MSALNDTISEAMVRKLSRSYFALVILMILAAGCAGPAVTPPALTDEPAPESAETTADLLPHSLYFLAPDDQAVSQVYRLERDGKTMTRLTSEPTSVLDYAVSLADGSLAYEVDSQLVLVSADGSDRRVLVDGGDPDLQASYNPVFSPDGGTLAYAHNGLNLYSLATDGSSLAIADQMEDIGDGHILPVETYSPQSYSPDGKKLLVALGHWEVAPSHAVYDPRTNVLVRYEEVQDYIYCCSFHGGPAWAPDSDAFYGIASAYDFAYRSGQLWRVDAVSGAVTRAFVAGDGALILPKELYPAADGRLYFFLGTYTTESGYFDAPTLEMVRSAPDGVTDRTVLRGENFVLMNEALWAPDASFAVVATALEREAGREGGVLELYYTDAQKAPLWLAPSGKYLAWGP